MNEVTKATPNSCDSTQSEIPFELYCGKVVLGTILGSIGLFLYIAQVSATSEFRGLGLIWAAMLSGGVAVFGILAAFVIGLLLEWLDRRKRLPRWLKPSNFMALGLAGLLLGGILGVVSSRPEAMLRQKAGIEGSKLKDLSVSGFDSFLARRWLFSFEIAPVDVSEIVSRLNLDKSTSSSFSEILKNDIFLRKLQLMPSKESKVYSRSEKNSQAGSSIVFAFDEPSRHGWILVGYQN